MDPRRNLSSMELPFRMADRLALRVEPHIFPSRGRVQAEQVDDFPLRPTGVPGLGYISARIVEHVAFLRARG